MEENTGSGLERLTDTIEGVVTGIPAPIRKNFFKAFGQLCTAAVDIPVAWLEGKASEIRVTTDARVGIIKKGGEDIKGEIAVPREYAAKASSKYASKIIKEQINLDDITLNAAKELAGRGNKDEPVTEKEIEDDWLSEFESHARLKSSDDMKLIFGKILSGEILNPGAFSIRTIRLISQLDNRAAKVFRSLCSQAVYMDLGGNVVDARVVSFSGNAATNTLAQYGLSFDNLNVLHEYGLIIPEYNSSMKYSPCIVSEDNTVMATICINNKHYALKPTDNEKYDKVLQLNGVALSNAGKELLNIIPIESSESYNKELLNFFESKHLKLVDVRRE